MRVPVLPLIAVSLCPLQSSCARLEIVGNGPPDVDMVIARHNDAGRPSPDLAKAVPDLAGIPPDLACTQGTPDHCPDCMTRCPGTDDKGTDRVCLAMTTCDIVCKDEYYDLNQDVTDGCESFDGPAHDTPFTATPITLPDIPDDPQLKSNPLNVLDKVYWDKRTHKDNPTLRPNGREDWFGVTAVGLGNPMVGMKACLGIIGFPPDNLFEVCISDINKTMFDPMACQKVAPADAPKCVLPPAMTDAGGPYFVRVRKLSGASWTANAYALFLQHWYGSASERTESRHRSAVGAL